MMSYHQLLNIHNIQYIIIIPRILAVSLLLEETTHIF